MKRFRPMCKFYQHNKKYLTGIIYYIFTINISFLLPDQYYLDVSVKPITGTLLFL